MKKIVKNSELEDGKHYWLCSKVVFDNGVKSDMKFVSRFIGDPGREHFENGTWAMDSNNQSLEKYDIYGPIPEPELKGEK